MPPDTDSTNHGWDLELTALLEMCGLEEQLEQHHSTLHDLMLGATEFIPTQARDGSNESLAACASLMCVMTAQHLAPTIKEAAAIQQQMTYHLKQFSSHESLDSPLRADFDFTEEEPDEE